MNGVTYGNSVLYIRGGQMSCNGGRNHPPSFLRWKLFCSTREFGSRPTWRRFLGSAGKEASRKFDRNKWEVKDHGSTRSKLIYSTC